jgi:hypothetical protein
VRSGSIGLYGLSRVGDLAKNSSLSAIGVEPGDWLSQAIDHHEEIEAAFASVKAAASAFDRVAEQVALALLLTGHSLAEEAVLYRAMALHDPVAVNGVPGRGRRAGRAGGARIAALSTSRMFN